MAALASGYFGQWIRPNSAMLPPTSGRSVSSIVGRMVASLCAVVASTGLIATLILVAITAGRGAAGAPPVAELLATLAGVSAAAPVGFAVARVSSPRLWPIATLAGSAFLLLFPWLLNETVLPNTGLSSLSVSLVWGLPLPEIGWEVPFSIAALRFGYFLLLGIAFTAMAGACLRRGQARDLLRVVGPGTIPLTVLNVVVLVSPRLPLVEPTPIERTCIEPAARVSVCVPVQDQALLGEVSNAVGSMADLVPPPEPVTFTYPIHQDLVPDGEARLPEPSRYQTRELFWHDMSREVAATLIDPVCRDWQGSATTSTSWQGVRSKLMTEVGSEPEQTGIDESSEEPAFGDGYSGFAVMSRAEFSTWLDAHLDEVRACSLPETDLP